MDQLQAYINQARQQGQNDAQIRQSLAAAGWTAAQISGGFSAKQPVVPVAATRTPSEPVQLPNSRRSSRRSIAVVCLVVFIIVVGGSSYALFGHGPQSSYQAVTQAFVNDIEHNDKSKADALESPAFKAEVEKYANTSSFYTACQQEGQLCTATFSAQFLDAAKKSYASYTASDGTKGMELVYTEKQTLSDATAGGNGCSSSSTTTLSIGAIPNGHTWFVDTVNDGSNATAQLCPAPGAKS